MAVALLATVLMLAGTVDERALWAYVVTLWIGGLKVWLGTLRAVAELTHDALIVRPLHQLRRRVIAWDRISGTEQMIGGDRLMIFYQTPRGQRFVALNLNLVKGRRDFLAQLEERLRKRGFAERTVERSRYLSPVEKS